MACIQEGFPIIDEYRYDQDDDVNINMKSTTRLRNYQRVSVQKLFWNQFSFHSGILVLPCGAGKTLIGINVVATLKKPAIIFCQSHMAVQQWREQFKKWTTISDMDICRFTSKNQKEWNPHSNVIITTYTMFTVSKDRRGKESTEMLKKFKSRTWGIMVLDEVHLAPAQNFKIVTKEIKSHCKLGLTATMVREDDMIKELPNLVGPKLYELDIFTLRMRNHIAPVICEEIQCPLTPEYRKEYDQALFEQNLEKRRLLYATNPNKIRIIRWLIDTHMKNKRKILVICDILFALDFYTAWLRAEKIDGKTDSDLRRTILDRFRKTKGGACVLISKVGDQSIDLPEADVVIQVTLRDGSRMQEGQRIGRIQRPHKNKPVAYFYSLISTDTDEVVHSTKRRKFLQDHGYSVTVLGPKHHEKIVEEIESISIEKQREMIDMIDQHLKNTEATKERKKNEPKVQKRKEKKPKRLDKKFHEMMRR